MTRSLQNRALLVTLGILFGTAIVQTQLCPREISNGRVMTSCSRQPRDECTFTCNPGFKRALGASIVTCGSDGNWTFTSDVCVGHDGGLIFTLTPGDSAVSAYIETVPTSTDGAPDFDSIKKLSFMPNWWLFSVGGDYALRQVYAFEYYTSTIYAYYNFSIGMSGVTRWSSIHRGVSKDYVKIAVDWINHNIYWTDPQFKWIVIQSLEGNDMYRVLIDDNLEGPHALALDPMEALLFWSDIGSFTKIEVSSLSGRNRKSLISSNLITPISLAADYVARRIYWIDSGRYTLESITYEGKERKILLRKSDSSFSDLTVYKDYLYVTDSSNNKVHFFNKTNGEKLKNSLTRVGESYLGVTFFHPEAQPKSVAAYCVNYGCDHICVTEKGGASCVCRDGYILNQDMKTCSVNNKYFHRGLMFSIDRSICIVDIRILTEFAYAPRCVLKINGTRYMVMDTDQRQIIIANDTYIYWASVDKYNYHLHVLTKQSGMISGLAWDGYDRNVYWSENDTGRIWRLSRESDTAAVFLSGLIRPRDIMILPHERLLYWISDRNGSTIEYISLDGSNQQVLLDNKNLIKPKSLSYDMYSKRIYFLDIAPHGINYVYSCKLNGSDLMYFLSTSKILEQLVLYKGHLLLTSNNTNGTVIMSYSIDLGIITNSVQYREVGVISSIKVFDENFRQNETGPCYNVNGGCEQICLSRGKSSICEYTFGFKLAPNGKNCVTDPIKDNFMLIEDSTHNNIYQISLTDETIQGINAKGAKFLTGVTYSSFHDLVIWGTEQSEISMIHLNGTGQKMFCYHEMCAYFVCVSLDDIKGGINNYEDFGDADVAEYMILLFVGDMVFWCSLFAVGIGQKGDYIINVKSFPLPVNVYRLDFYEAVISDNIDFYPNGFAVDSSTGNIYYTAVSYMEYVNMYESHIGVILPNGKQKVILTRLSYPHGLVVYPSKGLLFYADTGSETYIGKANMDGTQASILLDISNDRFPTELTIDYKNDYLYWLDYIDSSICYCKLDGTNYKTLVKYPHASLNGLAFYQDYLYFSSADQSSMRKVKISNPNETTEFADYGEFGSIRFISIYSSNAQMKNAFCSVGNGGCSTFCFPSPSGGLCACEDGVHLKDGSHTFCSNIPQCPLLQGAIIVSADCQRVDGSKCNFTCTQGYNARQGVKNVLCNGVTYTPADSCEAITCPREFSHGRISRTCEIKVGQSCDYECMEHGYKKNENISKMQCTVSGTWNGDTSIICQPITCPREFSHGRISRTCEIKVGQSCDYECMEHGYKKNENISKMQCTESGTWNGDTSIICQPITCPREFSHGRISSICEIEVGQSCDYECMEHGYKKTENISKILCTESGTWDGNTSIICQPITCPREFSHGRISSICEIEVGQSCDYECMEHGYKKNENISKILCTEAGSWDSDTSIICEASPAMLLAGKSEVNQAAIGSGVAIGVLVVIIVIVLTLFLILRRRKRNSDFVSKIMQEEVMNATFGPKPDNEYAQVLYENGAVHIFDAKKAIHSQNLTPHSINTGTDVSKICVESMAIPRPRAKEKNLTKTDIIIL